MKKKFLILGLILIISLIFCGCSKQSNRPNPNTLTETIGDKQIVYTYNDEQMQIVSSKTIYDLTTGITTEIIYYHEDKGWGRTANWFIYIHIW